MAKASRKTEPFHFENAASGQPGPDGSPIIGTFVTDSGIPGVETRSAAGLRTFTIPLSALRRQPLTNVTPPPQKAEPKRRPARVARMLALAHDLQDRLDRGEYRDQAALAAQLGFTRGRLSKLLDLTLLAPDIQEEVLFLEAVDGFEPIGERALRKVVRHASWADQRRVWREEVKTTRHDGAAGTSGTSACP